MANDLNQLIKIMKDTIAQGDDWKAEHARNLAETLGQRKELADIAESLEKQQASIEQDTDAMVEKKLKELDAEIDKHIARKIEEADQQIADNISKANNQIKDAKDQIKEKEKEAESLLRQARADTSLINEAIEKQATALSDYDALRKQVEALGGAVKAHNRELADVDIADMLQQNPRPSQQHQRDVFTAKQLKRDGLLT